MSDSLDPMSMNQVEAEILRLSRELTQTTIGLGDAATRAAQADVDYKKRVAITMISLRGHKGTVAEKDAEVHDRCQEQYERKTLAEATFKVFQEKGRNLRAQLDALRTLAANARGVMHNG